MQFGPNQSSLHSHVSGSVHSKFPVQGVVHIAERESCGKKLIYVTRGFGNLLSLLLNSISHAFSSLQEIIITAGALEIFRGGPECDLWKIFKNGWVER